MPSAVVPLEEAEERLVEVSPSPKIQLWVRTWGKRDGGIPVLFVHGGPGNCVADYGGINKDFFDASTFFVVEVDQRGTGKSQPSVRDPERGVANMQLYRDISMPQMSKDFETVRKELRIEKWLVFGGSWGSTLALDYAISFPEVCLGLIVRGIFLGTQDEHDSVYARKAFAGKNSKLKRQQLKEFDTFFHYVNQEVERRRGEAGNQEKALDPNDSERIVREYETLILRGDRMAAWKFYVLEENLMAEVESDKMDFEKIDEEQYPQAQNVAFFEARLFTRLTFEEPPSIVARLGALSNIKTWVVQGTGDAVCPDRFAKDLVAGLKKANVPHTAYFVDAGHKSSSANIKKALQQSVLEFADEASGIVSMKVTANKSGGFYAKSARSFFTGVEDTQGNKKEPVSRLKISGLGNSINTAVVAALAVESEGLATIRKIDTSYPEMLQSNRPCAKVSILLERIRVGSQS